MRIGLSGPHAIGKSTTAISLNKRLPDYLYVSSFAGPVAAKLGFDLNKPYSDQQLIDYQEAVLEAFIMSFEATAGVDTIYDRTPLDFAAYLYLGLKDYPASFEAEWDFADRCAEATSTYFDYVFIPQADLTASFDDKGNRPKFSRQDIEFRQKFESFIIGEVNNILPAKTFIVPKEHQYEARVQFIVDALDGN